MIIVDFSLKQSKRRLYRVIPYMCPFMLPQCDSTERKVSVSARCIDTDRQSCIPMHIPTSRAQHLQTNKTQKKNTHTHTYANVRGHVHCDPCSVSFKCIAYRETDGCKGFCFHQQKNEGTTFWL